MPTHAMDPVLACKPDFDRVRTVWNAYWEGEVLSRPPVWAAVPRPGMPHRLALAIALLAVLSAAGLRRRAEIPAPARPCEPGGRGETPHHWLGCAADPGPPRALAADERLLLGLPLDLNRTGARELAFVPGLSRRLAAEIVADRDARGPFLSVDDLDRVRGIGPKRLARAGPHLTSLPP